MEAADSLVAVPAEAEVAVGKAAPFYKADFQIVACKKCKLLFCSKKHNYIDFFAFL